MIVAASLTFQITRIFVVMKDNVCALGLKMPLSMWKTILSLLLMEQYKNL